MMSAAVKLMSCVVVASALFVGSTTATNTTNLSGLIAVAGTDEHAADDNVEATRRSVLRKPRAVSI